MEIQAQSIEEEPRTANKLLGGSKGVKKEMKMKSVNYFLLVVSLIIMVFLTIFLLPIYLWIKPNPILNALSFVSFFVGMFLLALLSNLDQRMGIQKNV